VKSNILFVINVISHYQVPLFEKISSYYNSKLKVISVRDLPSSRKKLGWSFDSDSIPFDYSVLCERQLSVFGKRLLLSPGIFKELFSRKYDVVLIGGYYTISAWITLLLAKARGSRVVLRSGTHKYCVLNDGKVSRFLKKIFIYLTDSYVAYGTMAKEYLVTLGADPSSIFIEYNTVDTQNMISIYQSLKTIDRYIEEKYKKELHFPSKSILFVGQMIERKNILTILKAMKLIDSLDLDIGLRLVGDGDQRSELEKYVERYKLKNVQFLGSVPPNEMYKYYIASDIICLLSIQEPWGLVINEAMCFGNAVLVSKECGCSCDLVRGNGVIIDGATDFHKVSESIINIFSSFEKLERMKKKSMSVARQYDINNAVSAYERAIFNMPFKKIDAKVQ